MSPDTVPVATSQQQAYRYVRQQILSGAFSGGEKLNPARLADELGISRMPVREALRQLDAEGLVTIRPNRGAIVTVLSPRDVQELFEMRAVLEALAVKLAMPNLRGEALDDLEHLRQRMDRSIGDAKAWTQRHAEFHDFLTHQAERPRLRQEINRMRAAVQPYLLLYLSVHHTPEMPDYEHGTIIDAIRSGNSSLVEICVRDHVLRAAWGVIEFVEAQGTSDLRHQRAQGVALAG
jgi:DNA-binding GntR family transcriptional regulator